ncbi:HupE/UreJ family protein [Paenibacillus tarimensis]
MRKILIPFLVCMIALWALVPTASAHQMPYSEVSMDFADDRVTADLILPLDRLEIAFGKTLTDYPSDVLNSGKDELTAYVLQHVKPVSPGGENWSVSVTGMSLQLDEQPFDLIVNLSMIPPDGAPIDRFTFNYDVVLHEIVTHSVMIFVRSDWNHAVTPSEPVLLGTLRADVTSVEVDRSGGSWWSGFRNIVTLGILHIAEGTDHLMFLLVLLLPAPLVVQANRWAGFGGIRHSLVQLLKVVTAFTAGHSLTLFAGALGYVPGSSQWIEVLIAVSILVSAIHALRPLFPGREATVAFGFGLVHGMAFASLIIDIGISAWQFVAAILGFNIGIEIMQLAVIVVSVPWLIILSVTRLFPFVRIAGACLAIIASGAWISERVTESSNPIAAAIDALTPYAAWLIVMLALTAIAAMVWKSVMRSGSSRQTRQAS